MCRDEPRRRFPRSNDPDGHDLSSPSAWPNQRTAHLEPSTKRVGPALEGIVSVRDGPKSLRKRRPILPRVADASKERGLEATDGMLRGEQVVANFRRRDYRELRSRKLQDGAPEDTSCLARSSNPTAGSRGATYPATYESIRHVIGLTLSIRVDSVGPELVRYAD